MTLVELAMVLVLVSVLAALAGPRAHAWMARRGAGQQLAADLSLARAQAVRQARTVSFRILDPTTYTITADAADGAAERTLRRVDLARRHRGATLDRGTGRIAFDARGMYRAGGVSTISRVAVTHGGRTSAVRVSAVGRIYHE
jgi:Tfp pilus assembly protein FimT